MIVVLVMGILAAAAVPRFVDSLQFHRVESAARHLKADLEHLRQTARLTSRVQTMSFLGLTYSVAGADVRNLDHPGETYSADLAAPPYNIDIATVNFNNGTSVSFDAYGMPSAAGSVLLQAGTHQCTVELNAMGKVRITSNP